MILYDSELDSQRIRRGHYIVSIDDEWTRTSLSMLFLISDWEMLGRRDGHRRRFD